MRWIVILAIIGVIVFFLMNQGDESAKKPVSSQSPVSQAAPPAQQPPVDPTVRLKQVAASVGVEFRDYRPQPDGGLVTVAWGGDQATLGGDFIEQCIRQGVIRDFDSHSKSGAAMENGRRIFIAQYSVKF